MKHLIYILLLLPCLIFGQVENSMDFSPVDSLAHTYTYNGDLKLLVSQLTDGYDSDILKARAIFAWITDNIAYDVKAYNKNKKPKPFKCKNKADCDTELIAYEDGYIQGVLRNKKGVCQGYANLFKRMCDYAGLQTDIISGYTKKSPGMVGKMGPLNHAWNGIIIDGKYYYLDATWAAGGCTYKKNGKLDEFIKDFDEYYWLTPQDKFHRNHYPKSKTPYSSKSNKEKYKNTPYIIGWMLPCLDVTAPQLGIIEAYVGDTITFEMNYSCSFYEIDKLQVNTNRKRNPSIWTGKNNDEVNPDAVKKQQYINYKKVGDTYTFSYVVDDKNIRYIEVLLNHQVRALKFNIKTKGPILFFGKKIHKRYN
ncbi:MAG: transglutaminase domain-containing protein [Bacteroidota bacterium]